MTKVLTSFMSRQVAEGQMMMYTYSILNDEGEFVSRNNKASFMVADPAILDHIRAIEAFIRDHKLTASE